MSTAPDCGRVPLMPPYTTAKAGVEALLTRCGWRVAHTGTKVGLAYFSFIDTDMVRESPPPPPRRRAGPPRGS